MIYFAYGSNLNWEQMKVRCPDCFPITTATLKGWKLQFRGPLDIEPDPKSEVQGVVFYISDQDLENLDYYEGYPTCYKRVMVSLIDNKRNQLMKAAVYVMTNTRKNRGLVQPSKGYLQCVLQGHEDFNISNTQVWDALDRAKKKRKNLRKTKQQEVVWNRNRKNGKQEGSFAGTSVGCRFSTADHISFWRKKIGISSAS